MALYTFGYRLYAVFEMRGGGSGGGGGYPPCAKDPGIYAF